MTMARRVAWAAFLSGLVLSFAGVAEGQATRRVVVLLGPERATELAEALRLELSARGLEMVLSAPPADAGGPLARAASAQEAARTVSAEATVWIESAAVGGGASVRAVGVDDDTVRHAPLPAPLATVEARVVALVGASLVDEIAASHETEDDAPPVTVRIAVAVEAPGRSVSVSAGAPGAAVTPPVAVVAPPAPPTPPVVPAIPPPAAAVVVRAATATPAPIADRGAPDTSDLPRIPRDSWNLEMGLLFAGVAGGFQATISKWLGDAWRIGPTANVVVVWADDVQPAFSLGGTLLRAGRARSGRFDFGVHAGLVVALSDSSGDSLAAERGRFDETSSDYTAGALYGWTAEALFGWGWELSSSLAMDLRFALGAAQVDGNDLVPVAWASLAFELPL